MNFNWNKETFEIKIWDGQYLGDLLSIDTETTIAPFTTTPDLVTFQAYGGGEDVYYVPLNFVSMFINRHNSSNFIFHNAPFDTDVIHKHTNSRYLYDHYDNNLIYDTGVMYRLLQLAVTGQTPFRYNLKMLTEKFLKVEMVKDERRENFAQFLHTPLEEIPQDYLEYGAIDVIATFKLYHILYEYIEPHDRYGTLLSAHIQVKGDLALNHIYKNGIGFDLSMRDTWLKEKLEELDSLSLRLADWGLIRGISGYKAQFKYIVEDLLGLNVQYRYKKLKCRKTEKGLWIYDESGMAEINKRMVKIQEGQVCHATPSISTQKEDLEQFESHSFISDFLKFNTIEKATTFVRDIESSVINPRYGLLLKTGRTSCSGGKTACNIQQIPKIGGIREMFIPKDKNNVLIDVDYSALELATLAQVCIQELGESVMGDMINEGVDLHRYYASILYGKPQDKITKDERQAAKPASFGFSGALGIKTFIQFAKGYGLTLSQGEAQNMKDKWFDAFPEMRDYLNGEQGFVFTLTGRKRNKPTFCAEKNTKFQGLASDGLKLALYNLDKVGYKIVAEVHDQVLIEAPREGAENTMKDIQKIMEESMRIVVPDVKIGTEGMVLERWTK